MGAALFDSHSVEGQIVVLGLLIIEIVIAIFLSIASIAAGVRRCHDCGWSGWVYLIALITVIGLLVLVFKKGDLGENRFGKISFLPWAS